MLYSASLNEFTESVTAVDDTSVRFDLKKPNPRYMLDYYGAHFFNAIRFVPEHIWKDVDDKETFKNNDPDAGLPVATGPYKFVRSGDTEAIWDVRDDWWGIETGFKPRPQVERVIWIPLGTPDRQIALAVANDVDWPETFSAGPFESILAQNPKWRAFTEDRPYGYIDACPFAMHINHESGALSDPAVRKAVNWAIDKAKFVNLAHEGVTPTSGEDSWLEPFIWPNLGNLPEFRDKNRDIIEKHEVELHSPDKAKAILDEAGYAAGSDGIRVGPNGEKLSVTISWVPTGYVEFPAPVESLVNDLQDVGFDAAQKQIQWGAFGDIFTGGFDLALIWVVRQYQGPICNTRRFPPEVRARRSGRTRRQLLPEPLDRRHRREVRRGGRPDGAGPPRRHRHFGPAGPRGDGPVVVRDGGRPAVPVAVDSSLQRGPTGKGSRLTRTRTTSHSSAGSPA